MSWSSSFIPPSSLETAEGQVIVLGVVVNPGGLSYGLSVTCVMSLFNFMTGFLTGMYAGLYAAKNYDVPNVPEPMEIVDKVKRFLNEHKKDD